MKTITEQIVIEETLAGIVRKDLWELRLETPIVISDGEEKNYDGNANDGRGMIN
jgi:hypothetical protein